VAGPPGPDAGVRRYLARQGPDERIGALHVVGRSRDPDDRFLTALAGILPPGRVATDPAILEGYRRDKARLVPAGVPAALVSPSSTVEVQRVLELASNHRVAVVTRGSGSGLAGGANATDGCIVLSLARMDQIVELDAGNLLATVEPGVLNGDLATAVAGLGLWYAPDPASAAFSTIGGNVATNAGGLCCVKYGTTRESVLGMEVVLADGSIVHTGRRTLKGVAGYDLTALFVGSEGTLGVVTEVTLRLRPEPPRPATLLASFRALEAAGRAIAAIRAHLVPSLLELMDRVTARAVDDLTGIGLDRDAAAVLIARSDAGDGRADEEIREMAICCEDAGATEVLHSSDPFESEGLMSARKMAFQALEQLGEPLLDDVAVPPARIPELLASIHAIADRNGVIVGTFGHAGEGNLHPTIVFVKGDPVSRAAAAQAFDEIVVAALALGGTISGEHGVGLLKRPYLEREIGEGAMRVHAAIKDALDPLHILNPGKMF
jgi:glycolate oxidase